MAGKLQHTSSGLNFSKLPVTDDMATMEDQQRLDLDSYCEKSGRA